MRCAGLDPGYSFGFGLLGGEKTLSGSHSLRFKGERTTFEEACEHGREWLDRLLVDLAPEKAFIAMPFISRKATPAALVPLFCFIGLAKVGCHRRGVPCEEVSEGDARKHVIGGVPRGTKAIKAGAIEACRRLGWPAADGHAADALIVAAFGMGLDDPEVALRTTPLFANRIRAEARYNERVKGANP